MKTTSTSVSFSLVTVKWTIKVTRPSFFGGAPSYFEALWYPHLYVDRKSNTDWITHKSIYNIT